MGEEEKEKERRGKNSLEHTLREKLTPFHLKISRQYPFQKE
jgi:hypothetical protein